jgi:hypothetical protein
VSGPRVMVTGSRHWPDPEAIYRRLAQLPATTVIVHGAAAGADAAADSAARKLGLPVERHPAQWRRDDGSYNPRAGFDRNGAMLDTGVTLVLAFRAAGKSNGTDDAIRGARQRGIPVEVHRDG